MYDLLQMQLLDANGKWIRIGIPYVVHMYYELADFLMVLVNI
jgi:hypothetical protein